MCRLLIFIIINRKLEKCCRTTVKISEKCGKKSVKSWKNVAVSLYRTRNNAIRRRKKCFLTLAL